MQCQIGRVKVNLQTKEFEFHMNLMIIELKGCMLMRYYDNKFLSNT